MSFHYTVNQPFTLPLGSNGRLRIFKIGEHITDPGIVEEAIKKHARHLTRHAMREPAPDETDVKPVVAELEPDAMASLMKREADQPPDPAKGTDDGAEKDMPQRDLHDEPSASSPKKLTV